MYDDFSARSMEFLRSLLGGAATRIGGHQIPALGAKEATLLRCLIDNFGQVRGLRGAALVAFLENWLTEVGISPVDAELHFLLPARVSTIRFGKDSEALRLFSQIVGLDSLETVANIAASAHTACSEEANHIEKETLPRHQTAVSEAAEALEVHTPESVSSSTDFRAALAQERSSSAAAQLKVSLDEALHVAKARLASDLGIIVPKDTTSESAVAVAQLDYLPGHIDAASQWLKKPLAALFPRSLGFRRLDSRATDDLRNRLLAFETSARKRVCERLDWAQKERSRAGSGLLLAAAAVFDPGANECPVCGQDLAKVPSVRDDLRLLRPLASHEHLHQTPTDLQRALVAELDTIVDASDRNGTERRARLSRDS